MAREEELHKGLSDAVVDMDEDLARERAQAVVDEIKGNGGEAIYVIVDASNVEDCKKIFDATIEAFGTVDILVNNAGMLSMSPLLDVSIEEWNKVFAVNVTSALYLTQLCAPVMKEKGKGVIVNVASVASYAAHHGFAAYSASKHAMAGLSKSMAWELGPEIRVNGIAPGLIRLSAGLENAEDLIADLKQALERI